MINTEDIKEIISFLKQQHERYIKNGNITDDYVSVGYDWAIEDIEQHYINQKNNIIIYESEKSVLKSNNLYTDKMEHKCSYADWKKLQWLTDFVSILILDTGEKRICAKNRNGSRDMCNFDKSQFEVISVHDIVGKNIHEVQKEYYGRNLWVKV